MPKKDPRVDAYIAKAKPFAQPILKHLRKVIHASAPGIVETVKWSSPSYEYKGILCGFAAFNEHATFGFWKHSLVIAEKDNKAGEARWNFGRLTSVKDLPSDAQLKTYIKKAMALNEEGVPAPHMVNRKTHEPLPTPKDLKAVLAMNTRAAKHFAAFSPSAQRDYIDWITEAKTEATRARRLETTIESAAEGKRRNWKYEKK